MSAVRRRLLAAVGALALVAAPAVPAANKYEVREVPYTEPAAPGPDETLIYVFRESDGALQKFAIIDNDTVVGVLTSGTFTYFVVPSGQHEIVAYVSPTPLMHYRVVPAPGKTVYLTCTLGYLKGVFMKTIDEATAKQRIAASKFTEIAKKGEKAKMDYRAYYDNLYK